MDISVKNPEVARFIEESVKAGHFRSREEVVEAGVARLMLDPPPEERESEEIDGERLAAIDEGLAQIARGEDRDFGEFAAEFRKKYLSK